MGQHFYVKRVPTNFRIIRIPVRNPPEIFEPRSETDEGRDDLTNALVNLIARVISRLLWQQMYGIRPIICTPKRSACNLWELCVVLITARAWPGRPHQRGK